MEIIKGDLIALAKLGRFDYIMHGCNCFHKMASGIAAQIAKEFPQAVRVDNETRKGDLFKLGNYSQTSIRLNNTIVVNAYTQYYPGQDFKLWALESVLFKFVNHEIVSEQTRLGVPLIGGGIGGGNPDLIKMTLEKYSRFVNLTLVEYEARPEKVKPSD